MASKSVMAYGDYGLELTPVEDVVDIGTVPIGAGNEVIPATIRWHAKYVPTGLLAVEGAKTRRNPSKYVHVKFSCTPFVRYTLDSGPVYGNWSSCIVRNSTDAADPLFAGLANSERARIARAVTAMEA